MIACPYRSIFFEKTSRDIPYLTRMRKYIHSRKVYIGIIVPEALIQNPCTSQLLVFPTAYNACGVSLGTAKGPIVIASDLIMSAILRHNRMRKKGLDSPSPSCRILNIRAIAITVDERNDIDAVVVRIICGMSAARESFLSLIMYISNSTAEENSFSPSVILHVDY